MGTSSRSGRRRRPATRTAAPKADLGPLLLKSNDAAIAVMLAGFVLLFVAIAQLASGGGGDSGAAAGGGGTLPPASGVGTSPAGLATGTGTATAGAQPTVGGEEAIPTLARRSIEVLPAGQWPSLYDSFTSEFRQRCSREQFAQAGVDAAAQLGDNLRLLRFKRTENITIEGSTAQAVVVGEIAGQSEYKIQSAFQIEDGVWKIAPASGTQGCEAFGRLSG
jgi:hypothetical protein